MNNEEKNVVQEGTTKPSFKEKLKKIFNVKNPWMWISLAGIIIIGALIGYIIISSDESTSVNEKEDKEEKRVLEVIDEEITIDVDSRYYLMNNIKFENLKEERITFYVNNNDSVISLEDKEISSLACGTATVYVDYQNLTGKTLLDDEFDVTVTGCEEKKASEIYLFKSLDDNRLSLDADVEVYTDNQTLIGTYECNSNDCKYYDISYYDFTDENADFVIYDDGYYLYNFKTQTRQKVSLTENDEYSDGISYNWEEGEKPLGITLDKEVDDQTVSAYFSFKEKQFVIDHSYGYETISYIPETNVYQATKVISSDDYLWELDILDGKTLENKKTFDIDSPCVGFWYEKHGSQEYYSIDNGACIGINGYQYYTLDFKKINSDFSYNIDFDDAGNLVFIEDGKRYVKYNDSGELVEKGKDYEQVLDVFSEHFFVVKDGYYKLISYKDYKEIAITPYVEGSYYQDHYSGYFDFADDPIYDEKQTGYYFLISVDPEDEYNESCYEYYYIPETGEVGTFDDVMECWGYAKPVLYLYPEKDNTKVTVSFEKPWLLTTTYPKFDKVWEVTADKNGDLTDEDGKYYYGLYWEEDGSTPVTFEEGFYVTKDNAIEFLEEKLSIIGLNERERNEFIMYWLPILEKNEKNLVYFELTEEREAYNKLNISPAPDSLLRVAIHVKKVDKKVKIKEQELTTFERVGFTAVEWGGVIH